MRNRKCLAIWRCWRVCQRDRNEEVRESLCRGLLKDSENEYVGEAAWGSSLTASSSKLLQSLEGIKSLDVNVESRNDLPNAPRLVWLLQRALHWQHWSATCSGWKIKHVILQGVIVLCQGWGCCHAIATLSSRHSSEQLCAVAKTLYNFTTAFFWHYHEEKQFKLGSSNC